MVELGEIRLALPRLGPLTMRPALLGPAEATTRVEEFRQPSEAIVLECRGVAGLLFVETRFALGLVNAALGISEPLVSGPLSRIERGILEGVLAAVIGQLDFGPGLLLPEARDVEVPPDPRAIEILADLHGQRGRAMVCGSEEFLVETWNSWCERPGAGRRTACLEIARTRVPVAQLATAEAGDTVVFDEEPCFSPTEPWPVRIRCGDLDLSARWHPDGALSFDEVVDLGDCEARTASDRGAGHAAFGPLAAYGEGENRPCTEVVATIAPIDARALAGLVRGVLEGTSRTQPILLKVGASPWAEGELVDLGGSPGVRITRKSAG
jgi:hypothetical protein